MHDSREERKNKPSRPRRSPSPGAQSPKARPLVSETTHLRSDCARSARSAEPGGPQLPGYKHKHELFMLAICVADCDLSRVTIP